jgi:hypothetical protein
MMRPSASAAVTKEPSMNSSRYTEEGKAPLQAGNKARGGPPTSVLIATTHMLE